MQGIENITGRIQAEAQAEIDRIQADAAREVQRITDSYAARAERESADILTRGQARAAETGSRLVSSAQMESRKLTLAAKREVLDQAFELALDKLTQLPEADYIALLVKLAVSAASTGTEQLILNQADRDRLGSQVAAQANLALKQSGRTGGITLSEQTRPIRGGLILSNGAVEVNCALETLVRLSRTQITGEVSKLLFP